MGEPRKRKRRTKKSNSTLTKLNPATKVRYDLYKRDITGIDMSVELLAEELEIYEDTEADDRSAAMGLAEKETRTEDEEYSLQEFYLSSACLKLIKRVMKKVKKQSEN